MKSPKSYAILAFLAGMFTIAATLNSNVAPTMRTNAPGEQSCGGCHTGNVTNNSNLIDLDLGGAVGYVPNTSYTMTFTINDNSIPANGEYGFTMTALDGSNLAAGTFVATSPANSSVQTANVTGQPRQYLGHVGASNATNTWTFDWQAPATSVGDITFYTVGNATNGDNSTSGDKIHQKTFVFSPITAPVAGITQNMNAGCVGETFTFTDNSTGTATAFVWDFGTDATPATASGAGPHDVTYAAGGSKNVFLQVSSAGGTDTTSVSISVNDLPVPTIMLTNGGTTLEASSATAYEWLTSANMNGPFTVDPTATGQTWAASNALGLFVVVRVTDANGCVGESAPIFVETVSIDNADFIEGLTVFPNPVLNELGIRYELTEGKVLEIELYDLKGALVLSKEVNALTGMGSEIIDMAGLPAGLYTLTIGTDEGQLHRKIMKE